ncbi:uncharacterized protein LOC119720342 isoform X2 [Patiria miniata]|uniref:Zinc finger PHD-type domain-containing protein n=1 Tax=Patiria miniata TaxID=46514 RepID=A0A913Z582_PATMI|nr:uncharacterized protein LOC119720342 isoform X2 [Patiria miniata]
MASSGNTNTPECLMCKSPVENMDNSWRRYSFKLSGPSLEQFEGQDGFLCSSCKSKHLQQTASQTQTGQVKKRPSFSFYSKQKARKKPKYSVPHVSSSHSKVKTRQNRTSYNCKLVEYVSKAIQESRYARAIRAILHHSKQSKKAFCTVASTAVRQEISSCALKTLQWSVTAGNIATFKWDKLVEEAASHMPILVNVLKGALHRHQVRLSTRRNKCMPGQRLGFILSLILYSNRPIKYSFIQSCMSVKLKRHGCITSIFDCLHALGVCQTRTYTPLSIDIAGTDNTKRQKQWQLNLSQQLESSATVAADSETQRISPCGEDQAAVLNETHSLVADMDDDASSEMSVTADDNSDNDAATSSVAKSASAAANVDDLPSTSSKHDSSSKDTSQERKDQAPEVKQMLPAMHNPHRFEYLDPGYIIVCDSVLMQLAKRRPFKEYQLQASTFAARNRVGFDQSSDYTMKRAEEIPLSCFLPTSDDWEGLKQRMCLILERILKDHLPFLKGVECSVPEQNQHSDALSERSEIASLGVIDENPYSTSGSVRMLESLHQFVPSYGDETLYPIVCFGDLLSVVKMFDAKCAKASGASAAERLEGLVQCPQDFHRRGVLLQDTIDRFCKEESAKETGTLCQIKEDFIHRSVKQKVAENFSDAENLLNFCTHALSTMLALNLAKLKGTTKTPADFPTSGRASQKKKWLTEFTEQMVDFLWPRLPCDGSLDKVCKQNETQVCLDKKDFGDILDDMVKGTNGCKCGESSGEGLVRCLNRKCGWFHYSCAKVDGPVEGDWWCSAECQASKSFVYCKCHKKTGKEDNMIQCELQSHCSSNEWYHPECIGGTKDLPDKWYCSLACKRLGLKKSKSDGVQEYSRALLYEGLCHLAFRDAVREGDGPAILSHWRINTLQFWNSKHLKYFILAHNMLAGVSGFYPARVAHDMTWNRVANLTGQADGNIGLDLVKEIPTHEYWEMVSRTQDGYPEKEGEQQGKLSDEFVRDLDGIFLKSQTSGAAQSAQEKLKFDHDVKYFASAYMHDDLFDFVPGRHHKSFPFFKNTVNVNCPELMGKKLLRLSQCMDSWRGVGKS